MTRQDADLSAVGDVPNTNGQIARSRHRIFVIAINAVHQIRVPDEFSSELESGWLFDEVPDCGSFVAASSHQNIALQSEAAQTAVVRVGGDLSTGGGVPNGQLVSQVVAGDQKSFLKGQSRDGALLLTLILCLHSLVVMSQRRITLVLLLESQWALAMIPAVKSHAS